MVLGHESSGIVHSVGKSVKSLKEGDRVAMEPGVPCRVCNPCKAGHYNLCPEMRFAATPPIDGTLCRYYLIPSDFCYKLPEHVSLEAGALVEPTAVAVHAVVRLAQIQTGDRVVVYGAGPVGLLCAAVARGAGARSVVVADMNEKRLEFARDFVSGGCSTFVAGKEEAKDAAQRLKSENAELQEQGPFGGQGADIVLECTGAAPCTQAAMHVARPGGTVVQVGIGREEINFPIAALCGSELNLKGSFRYKQGDYKIAVDLIARGVVNAERLISGKVKFEDAEDAFGRTKKGEGIKTLIAGPE